MIPACEPYLDGNELKYISDCVNNNWISSKGEYVDKFESGFARYCGCDYGISTTSGTAALHLALATLGIGKGDEVIIPTFTMVSTLLSVLYTGATPILIDCEPDTHNINVDKIEEKISTSTTPLLTLSTRELNNPVLRNRTDHCRNKIVMASSSEELTNILTTKSVELYLELPVRKKLTRYDGTPIDRTEYVRISGDDEANLQDIVEEVSYKLQPAEQFQCTIKGLFNKDLNSPIKVQNSYYNLNSVLILTKKATKIDEKSTETTLYFTPPGKPLY